MTLRELLREVAAELLGEPTDETTSRIADTYLSCPDLEIPPERVADVKAMMAKVAEQIWNEPREKTIQRLKDINASN